MDQVDPVVPVALARADKEAPADKDKAPADKDKAPADRVTLVPVDREASDQGGLAVREGRAVSVRGDRAAAVRVHLPDNPAADPIFPGQAIS